MPVKPLAAAACELYAEEFAEKRGVCAILDGTILPNALCECCIGLFFCSWNGRNGCRGLANDSRNSLSHCDARKRILRVSNDKPRVQDRPCREAEEGGYKAHEERMHSIAEHSPLSPSFQLGIRDCNVEQKRNGKE